MKYYSKTVQKNKETRHSELVSESKLSWVTYVVRILKQVQHDRCFFVLLVIILFSQSLLLSQAENVPANHSVYPFFKRMELKGIIERYHDAVLPISRREVAQFLQTIKAKQSELTEVERAELDDFFVEFEYDLSGTTNNAHSLFGSSETTFTETVEKFFSEKEKYLYTYTDSNLSLFMDGLFTLDVRRSTGNTLGGKNAEFVQFGGRIRGTIYDHLGYYLQATNAQFWGERAVLQRDNAINQAYTLGVYDAQNFDFVEGYARYDAGIFSVQAGRERVLWGNGYGDKLILSENPRVFDFIRADAQYKSFKYTFLHGWLLGKRTMLQFTLPSDPTYQFDEPVVADKYFASHRFEFSFPKLFDIGFQEVAIYSNRSPDLAYLNPVTLIESAQRSREERDNILWAFDIQTHFLNSIELQATVFFDDLNFPKWGTNDVQNKNAFQVGLMAVDPFTIRNSTFAIEYTHIEPYTFSHNRSRDNDYGSGGRILGHHIGPNADSWYFRLDYLFTHRLKTSCAFEVQRNGENIYNGGLLVQNVGGDFLQPHRDTDLNQKEFLGGNYIRTYNGSLLVTYEIANELFLDFRYKYQQIKNTGLNLTTTDHDFGIALRADF